MKLYDEYLGEVNSYTPREIYLARVYGKRIVFDYGNLQFHGFVANPSLKVVYMDMERLSDFGKHAATALR